MFLIVSSSVYPAVIASIENKEMLIVAEAAAQLSGNSQRDTDTINHYAYRSQIRSTSPTSTDSSPADLPLPNTDISSSSSSPPMKTNTKSISMNSEDDDIVTATAINPGDLIHTLWEDSTPGVTDIFYKRDGADFDPTTVNFSDDPGVSFDPAVAVLGTNVHIVWHDDDIRDIFYGRSIDSGGRFAVINLSNDAGDSESPSVAVSGNNVHVVWTNFTAGDILYRRSTDGGASFTEPTKNLSDNAGVSGVPAIAVSGDTVHVVWEDNTPGNNDILYRRSVNGGSTFPNIIKNLSDNAGFSARTAIAVSGNTVHVVWQDNTSGIFDILHRRSLNSGDTFPNIIKNLSGNVGTSQFPSLAVSGNNVYVVWDGESKIFYRASANNGDTFPSVITNLSGITLAARDPVIAVS